MQEIRAPVLLWHGEADALVPVGMGRHIAALIPKCRTTFVPDAGHYWVFDHVKALLSSLRAAPVPAAG